MNDKFIILLTACVAPKGMPSTVIKDENIRLKSYIDAVRYYIDNTSFYIVFVDNSNVDLSTYFEMSKRLEFIKFSGNDYEKKTGKGFGEGKIIEYALNNSSIIKRYNNLPIIKITGRHIVTNLKEILSLTNLLINKSRLFVAAHINHKAKSVISDMFVASYKFYSDYLIKNSRLIDESKGHWFEHALYFSVYQAYRGGVCA
jgi:hypothetical protein